MQLRPRDEADDGKGDRRERQEEALAAKVLGSATSAHQFG
jgi:hypothetical protein